MLNLQANRTFERPEHFMTKTELHGPQAPLHEQLKGIRKNLQIGDHLSALTACRRLLPQHPNNESLLALLLRGFQLKGDSESELSFLANYAKQHDLNSVLYLRYVSLLNKTCRVQQALDALDNYPHKNHPAYKNILIEVLQRAGQHNEALNILQKSLAAEPNNWQFHFRSGVLQHSLGLREESIESLKTAYKLNPDSGAVYWHLANIKSYTLTESERRSAKIVSLSKKDEAVEAMHANYALGKYYEDNKKYAESFTHYSNANHHQRKLHPYDKSINTKLLNDLLLSVDANFKQKREGWGFKSTGPIFIVGLPRSGTTLLEQILCSHSKISAMGELYNIIHCARTISIFDHITPGMHYENYTNALQEMNRESAHQWGKRYFEDTQIHRGKARFFVDKMPSNFWHIPLIKTILPDAKIIDIRRHPLSSGFSVFKQCFPKGHNYSNGLKSTGRNYKQYTAIMNHYNRVYPNSIHTIKYESLVRNTEHEIRNLFTYLELEFENNCLHFHKTRRAIRTPSSEQVRQPIFEKGILQWKNYEEQLTPLQEILMEIIHDYEKEF